MQQQVASNKQLRDKRVPTRRQLYYCTLAKHQRRLTPLASALTLEIRKINKTQTHPLSLATQERGAQWGSRETTPLSGSPFC